MNIETTKTASLTSVSLAGLLAGQADSINDLVISCKTNGFFYLDFRDPSTSHILKLVEELAVIGKSVFKLPLEEKEEYSTEKYLPSRLLGYGFLLSSIEMP
jgi:isopenicillin N synthase-like dioxygenase